ncbi:whi5 like domain-containing protein [Hirsutella rhossiliensis]|uniref:Whi5 like domain-containing protein n=1 Tax=Hirsutella rhossiliensis TaxID=111463 RepID=A0A9P8N671_9HYPO|nr:whi5 like domain-containing protein [Hirsutella rhossiliensis]KAH0967712.1 whi5 like domain-containing protein [Hirsutella rhossiliensis]
MRPDWRAETSPHNTHAAASPSSSSGADTRGEKIPRALAGDDSWTRGGDPADPTSRPALVATSHRRPPPTSDDLDLDMTARQQLRRHLLDRKPRQLQPPMDQRSAASSAHSFTRSVTNSQESAATTSTDQIVTPPPSDTSAGLDGSVLTEGGRGNDGAKEATESQLHQLSAVAAVQDRMVPDEAGGGGSRKRMADGAVKTRDGSVSPVKGHSRTTSAISMASTTGSNIGELSAELKTLLSYAMVKVNHGWQSRSLDEVESLASQAVSPTSSAYTVHRPQDASTSPRQPVASTAAHVHFPQNPTRARRESNSPPSLLSPAKPALAAAASIQPAVPPSKSSLNARRNSNPRYTPTMLSRAPSASPHTPGPAPRPDTRQPSMSRAEQDVAESLLFMSSPGNSTNLKHTFSPSISPGAQQPIPPRNVGARHALPSGPRKALPTQRPVAAGKKVGGMPPPPGSPMDLDSPRSTLLSPVRGAPKRRANGASSHVRASLSLPSGLGMVPGNARKSLRDEDIERMLDRAGTESPDSSDGEDIQLPPGRRGVASAMET